jgi:hypothetical protein
MNKRSAVKAGQVVLVIALDRVLVAMSYQATRTAIQLFTELGRPEAAGPLFRGWQSLKKAGRVWSIIQPCHTAANALRSSIGDNARVYA